MKRQCNFHDDSVKILKAYENAEKQKSILNLTIFMKNYVFRDFILSKIPKNVNLIKYVGFI